MEPTYLFYDIESTGLNKCFDQVLQFAAIRTDLNFNEIERHEIFVKLNPLVIPSPGGLVIHRIPLKKMQQGEPEVEAMEKIHGLLNHPGTISLGYNTLNFDDEFLRFSFYRNLLPPYTHQFANQCRRMDLYPITVMYYLFKNEALNWPMLDGRVSLKLENLNAANNLAKGAAHDAMVDVEVTLALAKALQKQTDMWEYVTQCFHKATDMKRLKNLPFSLELKDSQYQEALIVNGKLGHENSFIAPVVALGQHNHYRNQSLWLRLDLEDLQEATADNIAEKTFVIRKKVAEELIILPALPRFLKHVTKPRKELTDKNRQWLKDNPEVFAKIRAHHCDYKYPAVPNMDVSTALYDLGFPPPYEEKLYAQFHKATPEKKEKVALKFADPVRQELAMRLLAMYYPEHLSSENQEFYQRYLAHCQSEESPPIDFRNQTRLTKGKALTEVEKLLESGTLDEEQRGLLGELQEFLGSHLVFSS